MSDQMRPEPSGPQMDDLLGAFALDAVDPDERELVERHIAVDPVSRAEVDEMRETAAVLASLPRDEEGAPPGLWDRIAGAISEPGEGRSAEPIPITRAKRRASISARVVMPIAAAAAIVIAVLAVQLINRTPDRAGNLTAAYDHAIKNGASSIPLQSDGGRGAVAAEIALQSDGTGYLRADHLAALPQGKTYQLWALVDRGKRQRAISAGVLGRDPQAAAFHVAAKPAAFAITVEDAPGVVRSKQTPLAVGKLSA
jgi:anti-sigma-K factor RskA